MKETKNPLYVGQKIFTKNPVITDIFNFAIDYMKLNESSLMPI